MKQLKKRRFVLLILFALATILFMPLEWVGVPRSALRGVFGTASPALTDDPEAAQHVVRAEILSEIEQERGPSDTSAPPNLQIVHTFQVLEVYRSKDIYGTHGRVYPGDVLEFQQLIPLYGRSLAARLIHSPSQVRLPIAQGDELMLFLNPAFGMGRRMYHPVHFVQLEQGEKYD